MKMHRALRLPGGAGGESDEADVVGGRIDGIERRASLRHVGFEESEPPEPQ